MMPLIPFLIGMVCVGVLGFMCGYIVGRRDGKLLTEVVKAASYYHSLNRRMSGWETCACKECVAIREMDAALDAARKGGAL